LVRFSSEYQFWGVEGLAFSHDGKRVAVAGLMDHRVRQWDIATGRLIHPFGGHAYQVYDVAYSPDGKSLATGSLDRTVRLWDVATGTEKRRLDGFGGRYSGCLAFAPDGSWLAAPAEPSRAVGVWDTATGRQPRRCEAGKYVPQAVALRRDGVLLAAGTDRGAAGVWEVESGKVLLAVPAGRGGLARVHFAPDGRFLAFRHYKGDDNQPRLWDVVGAKPLGRLPGQDVGRHVGMAFSPDGGLLATIDEAASVQLWDLPGGRRHSVLAYAAVGRDWLNSVAFAPDGRLALTGHGDGTVRLWEVATGQVVHAWKGHQARIFGLAFAPDGRTIASGSEDATAVVWDLAGLFAPLAVRPSLESQWSDLGAADTGRAYRAIWGFASGGEEAVADLRRRLSAPSEGGLEQRLARLIAALDDDRFDARERATHELRAMGKSAEAALRQALAVRTSPEARRRIVRVLGGLEEWTLSATDVQRIRAIQALELAGTPAARRLLETLTQRALEERLVQEAKASLARLARRPATP